jgi:hypothetical protein
MRAIASWATPSPPPACGGSEAENKFVYLKWGLQSSLIPCPREVPSGGEEFWYDIFALSPDREHELRVLCSKDLLRCVRAEPQVQCAGMGVGLDTAEDPRAQIQCTPRAYCPSTESVWTRDGPLTGGAPH